MVVIEFSSLIQAEKIRCLIQNTLSEKCLKCISFDDKQQKIYLRIVGLSL